MTLAVDVQNFFNYGSVTCGLDEKFGYLFLTLGNGCIVGGGGHEMQTTYLFQNKEELEEFRRILNETIEESLASGEIIKKTMFDQPDGLPDEEEEELDESYEEE